ncbi:hypothetical protein [Endozoicomonas sp. SESOKO1]|uniref:hypothetical protein n=1 Tax=Endozoicomonas sp. SESOKO1 TaxID=2828742 RepID=UPI002147DDFB|nr:hypothetical protein [Endozoicomonas sp. SESOKO1]
MSSYSRLIVDLNQEEIDMLEGFTDPADSIPIDEVAEVLELEPVAIEAYQRLRYYYEL